LGHCGRDAQAARQFRGPKLPLVAVQDALPYNNNGEKMVKKWEYAGQNYFRSKIVHVMDDESCDVVLLISTIS